MGKLIILIDDDPEDIELMADAIAALDAGHACWTFTDPSKAIERLRADEVSPDFVFLDMNMPKLNGEDLLIELRKLKKLKNTKIIVQSTADADNQLLQMLANQKAAFFQKPSTLAALQMILQQLLNQ